MEHSLVNEENAWLQFSGHFKELLHKDHSTTCIAMRLVQCARADTRLAQVIYGQLCTLLSWHDCTDGSTWKSLPAAAMKGKPTFSRTSLRRSKPAHELPLCYFGLGGSLTSPHPLVCATEALRVCTIGAKLEPVLLHSACAQHT
eukprot:1257079-Amphidinium_carterae.1